MPASSAKPTRDLATQPNRDLVTQPSRDLATQPNRDLVTQPNRDLVTQPNRDRVTQPNRDRVTQPTRDLATQPNRDLATQPNRDLVTQPNRDRVTQPNRDLATQPTRDLVTQPSRDLATQPSRDLATQPTRNLVTQPTRDLATQPTRNLAIKPSRDLVTKPSRDRKGAVRTARRLEARKGSCQIAESIGDRKGAVFYTILALFAITAVCHAQPADIRVQVPLIVAPTTVVDARGRLVNGLRRVDFTLYDNGRPQRIQDDIAYEPVSLVLAVQCGGKVGSALTKVQRIANVVDALVVGEGGEAALVAFDDRVRTVQPFTNSSSRMARGLVELSANGKKHRLFDAVKAAADLLKSRQAGRRRILLLASESHDRGSEAGLASAILGLQAANISLYAVVMNRFDDESEDADAVPLPRAEQPLKEAIRDFHGSPVAALTRFTGGRQYSFFKQRTLENELSAIGEEIHGQYLLSYVPDDGDETGFHEIRVSVDRRSVTVRTRPGYWLPRAE